MVGNLNDEINDEIGRVNRAFYDEHPLSFDYSPATMDDIADVLNALTKAQRLEKEMRYVAFLLHQASSGVLLSIKHPAYADALLPDARRATPRGGRLDANAPEIWTREGASTPREQEREARRH